MRKWLLISMLLALCALSFAQALNDYRSNGSGNWGTVASWQRFDGTNWVAATTAPNSSNANVITIRSPHSITVATSVVTDQTTVENSAKVMVNTGTTLTVANGSEDIDMLVNGILENKSVITPTGKLVIGATGVYQHNRNGGTIPTATWDNYSTCEIIGLTSTVAAGGVQSFYNLTWNSPLQTGNFTTAANAYKNIRGHLKIVSTGTGRWIWNGTAITSKTIGSYEQTGGYIDLSAGSFNTVIDLNGSFTMTGGTFLESGSSTGTKWIFKYPGETFFDHTAGTISGTISVDVYNGTTLDIVNLPLAGSGNFNLQASAGLVVRDAAGITSSGTTGSVQMTGTRTFSNEGIYVYRGSSAQVSGNALPANVHDLVLDNSAGLTLTNPVTVNGTLTQTAGTISSTPAVDGYFSQGLNYLTFDESGVLVSNFSVSMSQPNLMPSFVNRQWTIGGTFTGDKYVTFYWNDADDNSYDWSMDQPAVYQGNVKLSAELYDTDADPSWITVIMTNTFTKATYRIGTDTGQTLPIELSSFTAVLTNTGRVRIQWITQSETGGAGYQILRNSSPELNSATLISGLIPATNSAYAHTYIFEDTELNGTGTYYYWLQSRYMDGTSSFFGPLPVDVTETGGADLPAIPSYTAVKGIFPNPFNPSTTLKYELAENELVSLSIFNTRGQLIRSYAPVSTPPGPHRITWDGTDSSGRTVASGVYLFSFQAGKYTDLRKAILMK